MRVLAIKYKSSFKKLCCCGCYFDKVFYMLNTNQLISEGDINAHWHISDYANGVMVIVCDDVFSLLSKDDQKHQSLVFAFEQLYEFELSK